VKQSIKINTLMWPILLAILAVVAAACGPAQDSDDEIATLTAQAQSETVDSEEPEEEATAEQATEEEVEEPAQDVISFEKYAGASQDDIQTTSSGLEYVILSEGDGDIPEVGQVVTVHYTGWLEDGTEFDSSRGRDEPFQFALGLGMVIAGWDEGIAMMPVGTRAQLIIPSDLAYGEAGRPGIPPDSTLIFDVELLDIQPGPPESPTEIDDGDYEETDSGLQYYDLEVGDGAALEEGQSVLIHYTGWLEDGSMFDSSLSRGQPIGVVLGGGQLFPGWEEGLASMNVGGIRQLVIPPELAFGEEGAGGGIIPPNAVLIMEIELLEAQ
jgi:peptidylprolyl isomerase